MWRCIPLLLSSGVTFLLLSGCAGDRSSPGHIAETPETEQRPHPLSYQSIQLAAHSEGQPVVDVGFNHRYDVFCVLFPEVPMVYRNCKIVGVTGQEHQKSGGLSSFSKGHWEPSGIFDDMLVIETEDGRLAYIPPSTVKYIEESASSRHRSGNAVEFLPRN